MTPVKQSLVKSVNKSKSKIDDEEDEYKPSDDDEDEDLSGAPQESSEDSFPYDHPLAEHTPKGTKIRKIR